MGHVHETALNIIEAVEDSGGLDIFNMLNHSIKTMATTLLNDEDEWDNFIEFIKEGNNPEKHLLYHAAFALGDFFLFKKFVKAYCVKNADINELMERIEKIEEFFKIIEESHV